MKQNSPYPTHYRLDDKIPRIHECEPSQSVKINGSGYTAYQRVFGRNPPQVEDAVLECGGADLGVVSRHWHKNGR